MLKLGKRNNFLQSRLNRAFSSTRLEQLRAQLKIDFIETENNHNNKYPQKSRPLKRKKLSKPRWLSVPQPTIESSYLKLKETVSKKKLATVCEEARCPNIHACWGGSNPTATIMIMGDTCTRACRFCHVKTSNKPTALDPEEPKKVAEAITAWNLSYVVLTSVDRDDLVDQGANHFRKVVQELRNLGKDQKQREHDLLIECLTPDFQGQEDLVKLVATSGLDVFAHNVETVERLTPRVRDRRAKYEQSLQVLKLAKETADVITKSSIMLGLGEKDEEIEQTLLDLRANDVDVVTFGQYLQPNKRYLRVEEYVHPDKFSYWKQRGEELGFLYVASGPMVRSSYKAGEFFLENMLRRKREGDVKEQKLSEAGGL
eukprot:snap_masked-scaffold_16-processed-gene-1.24-mRNA-1 protein AED:0.00 eAED:0.00 QI:0/-1/0/1/-1/1/1/0/371